MPTQHLRSKSRKKGLFLTHSIFVDQLRIQDSRLSFYTRIIIYISLFSLAPVFEVFSSKEPKAGVAAEQVYIPKYGKNGEIIWSLNAKEVNPNDENLYFVVNPVLKTLDEQRKITKVSSDNGFFDLEKGSAQGIEKISIDGTGFQMKGEDWKWEQRHKQDGHNFLIKKDAYAYFEKQNSTPKPQRSSRNSIFDDSNKSSSSQEPLVATADQIELISGSEGNHEFQLNGKVMIRSIYMEINCSKMHIYIDQNETNETSSFGSISRILAQGKVQMRQFGRTSNAQSLIFDSKNEEILLENGAEVTDSKWGKVKGDKIRIDLKTNRAQVLGSKLERPRVEIPNIGKLKFPNSLKRESN